jgi:hypothetical protein
MRVILKIVNIGVQIITTIPEISSADHSRIQAFDKRILYVTSAVFSINLNWL